jgi:hypothetical protein
MKTDEPGKVPTSSELLMEILNAAEREGAPLDTALDLYNRTCDAGRLLDEARELSGAMITATFRVRSLGIPERALRSMPPVRDFYAAVTEVTQATDALISSAQESAMPSVLAMLKQVRREFQAIALELDAVMRGGGRA